MIFKDGVFVIPTEEAALEQFAGKGDHEPALAILTQTLDRRSASVLDALADELVRIMLDDDDSIVRIDARLLLEKAARGFGGGTPYERMQQTFIDLYEGASDAEMAATIFNQCMHQEDQITSETYMLLPLNQKKPAQDLGCKCPLSLLRTL